MDELLSEGEEKVTESENEEDIQLENKYGDGDYSKESEESSCEYEARGISYSSQPRAMS